MLMLKHRNPRDPDNRWITQSESIERKARQIARRSERSQAHGDDYLSASLEREVSIIVETIDSERELHRIQLRHIKEEELYIGTDLLGVEARTPRYSPYRYPEREKLQRRRGMLTKERRELESTFGSLEVLLESDPSPTQRRPVRSYRGDNSISPTGIQSQVNDFDSFMSGTYGISASPPDFVAHSMGGLIVRKWLSNHVPLTAPSSVVFLGTPHFGVPCADGIGSCSTGTGDMRRGSAFLVNLHTTWETNPTAVRCLDVIGLANDDNVHGWGDGLVPGYSATMRTGGTVMGLPSNYASNRACVWIRRSPSSSSSITVGTVSTWPVLQLMTNPCGSMTEDIDVYVFSGTGGDVAAAWIGGQLLNPSPFIWAGRTTLLP